MLSPPSSETPYRKRFFDAHRQISYRIDVLTMRQGGFRKTDQAPSDFLHGDTCIFVLHIIRLDPVVLNHVEVASLVMQLRQLLGIVRLFLVLLTCFACSPGYAGLRLLKRLSTRTITAATSNR
jgi:hypothetical protein